MSDITIHTVFNLARQIDGEFMTDIAEEIHEAAVDGVTSCGNYDVDIQGGSDEYITVRLSGKVDVFFDSTDAIHTNLYDEHDVDGYDAVIEDVSYSGSVWGETTTVEVNYTASVEQEIEHENTASVSDLLVDMRRVLSGFGAGSVGAEARESFRSIILTFMGADFLEAWENGDV